MKEELGTSGYLMVLPSEFKSHEHKWEKCLFLGGHWYELKVCDCDFKNNKSRQVIRWYYPTINQYYYAALV